MSRPTLETANFQTALTPGRWQVATWNDYVQYRDSLDADQFRLFFHHGYLLVVEMGGEGIDHAVICDLFTSILFLWFSLHPEQTGSSLGQCLLEKAKGESGAPDLVLYLGDDYPQWQMGELRRVDLNHWRPPDLVGEIAESKKATLTLPDGLASNWLSNRVKKVKPEDLVINHGYHQPVLECKILGIGCDRTLMSYPNYCAHWQNKIQAHRLPE